MMTRLVHHNSPSIRWLRSVLVAAVTASTLLIALPTPAGASRLSGFGAPLSTWQSMYRADTGNCNASNCYGPVVPHSSARYEFTYVTTARGRVDGFDEALAHGTPLLRAQLEIAQLFPADVQMGSLQIVHHDAFGNSCAFYDLQSKTILSIFGKRGLGSADGTVGVELATVLPSGATTYNPDDLDLALIVPTYVGSDSYC